MTSFKVITPVFFQMFPSFLKKYIYFFFGLVNTFS